MASAGPYANLHLTQTDNHASTPSLSFLQATCPSCCQPRASKHGRQFPYNHQFSDIIYHRERRDRCIKNNDYLQHSSKANQHAALITRTIRKPHSNKLPVAKVRVSTTTRVNIHINRENQKSDWLKLAKHWIHVYSMPAYHTCCH